MEFFEKRIIFLGKNKQHKKKLQIYRKAKMIGNTHLFPLHNESCPMPVG